MEFSLRRRSSSCQRERGIYVVLLALMVAALIMLGGLLIESANLYRAETRLARAARAGAIAGVSYVLTHGWFFVNRPAFLASQPNDTLAAPDSVDNVNRQALISNVRDIVVSNLYDAGMEVGDNTSSAAGDIDQLTINVNYAPNTDTVTVTLTYNVLQLFLPESLPGIGDVGCAKRRCPVTTTASATRNPANIVMVLDTSGSMACPTTGACGCRRDNSCVADNSVMTALKNAAQSFYMFFNPHLDHISVVPFNLSADPNFVPIRGAAGALSGFGASASVWDQGTSVGTNLPANRPFRDVIRRMRPFSNTNPCDGLITAAQELQRAGLGPTDQPVIVFFTDGAPNAGRYQFVNAANNRLTTANTINDWYMYSLEWVLDFDPGPALDPRNYLGPSQLVNCSGSRCLFNGAAQSNLFNFQIGEGVVNGQGTPRIRPLPNAANGSTDNETFQAAATGTNIVCGSRAWLPTQYMAAINGAGNSTGCLLTDMGFRLPGVAEHSDISGTVGTAGTEVSFNEYGMLGNGGGPIGPNLQNPFDYEQLPYHCAIRAADAARVMRGARIYAIGLGQPPPPADARCPGSDGGDPYQDVSDAFSRKDIFLARLALDPVSLTNETSGYRFNTRRRTQLTAGTCPNHSRNRDDAFGNSYRGNIFVGSGNIESAQAVRDRMVTTLNNPDLPPEGAYFPALSANELQEYFTQIAKQILLRQSQ